MQQPTPAADRARAAGELQPGLDGRSLALASVASVLGGIVASAAGGGPLATLICAAISPWITAFLTHPGPHRVRRGVAVLLLAGLIGGSRKAVAAVRTSGRGRSAERRDREAGPGGGPSEVDPRLTRAWLRQVSLTAALSLPIAVATVTAVEALRGEAFAADRRTTFFGGTPSDPTPTPTPTPTTEPGKPTLQVPDELVARAGDRAARRVTYRVTAADAAGNPLLPVCHPPSGARFPLGDTRVDCSATDVDGERARASFVVSVRRGGAAQPSDHAKPKLTLPAGFTRDAATASGARVTYAASARDAVDGPLTPACRPVSGRRFALGPTRVVCTATDAAGNTARGSFAVSVVLAGGADDTRPEITVPASVQENATSATGATVRYEVSATDNRDGSLRPRCAPPSGSVFAIGSRTVSCDATDAAGNKATTKSFGVTVVDGPPVLHLPPTIKREATSTKGARVTYQASATDAVDGAISPDCSPRSGRVFKLGTNPVTCTATDSKLGTDRGTFNVVVLPPPDTTPPVIQGPTSDVPRTAPAGGDGTTVRFRVIARDGQDRVPVTCRPPSGSFFPLGPTPVTCTARDDAGNEAVPLRFDVVVNPPVE